MLTRVQELSTMNLLIVSNYYPPEVGSGPHLIAELAESLVDLGHEVTVVTGFPRYNLPCLPREYRNKVCIRQESRGLTVLRVNTPNFYGSSVVSRGMVQMLAPPVLGLRAGFVRRPDLVYTVTPPLVLGVVAYWLARRYRVPCVVNVQDLFPQTMIDLGVLRNRRLIKIFERMESYVYRKATAITVMSDGNRDFVVRRGAMPESVHTVSNWVDTDFVRPGERMNGFRSKHDLGDAFLVLFAGTMGWSQGLEVVIEAARRLDGEKGIQFVMVGSGGQEERLRQLAAGVSNIRFLPMQPKEDYPMVLAAADACLATLRPEVVTPTVPSKIATIMSAGRPVLASFPPGDAPKLIQDAHCGIVTRAGDAAALADAIITLYRDPDAARQMGENGRKYAVDNLSRVACVAANERVFELALGGNR